MQMRISGIFIISAVFFFASCKKKGEISGKVTNLFDGSPVEGIQVQVHYSNGSWLNYKSGEFAPVTTDSEGSFSFDASYKRNKRYVYAISLRASGGSLDQPDSVAETVKSYLFHSGTYAGIDASQDNQTLNKDKSQHFDFKVIPTARLLIVVKREFPNNPSNPIRVMIDDPKMNYPDFYDFELRSDLSQGVYKYVVPVNGKVKIRWIINNNEVHAGTVELLPFKKTIYQIKY